MIEPKCQTRTPTGSPFSSPTSRARRGCSPSSEPATPRCSTGIARSSSRRSRRTSGRVVDMRADEFFAAFAERTMRSRQPWTRSARSVAEQWPAPLRVRMGVHRGRAQHRGGDGYVGLAVHHAARVCQTARGGEILVSHAVEVEHASVDLGEVQLKGIPQPTSLRRILADGLERDFPAAARRAARGEAAPRRARRRLGAAPRRRCLAARGARHRRRRAGRRRRGSARARRRDPPRRRDRRHPHAADEDRRGDPGRARDPPPLSADGRARPLVVHRRRERARPVPGRPARGSATCSRSGSPTSTTSSPRSG